MNRLALAWRVAIIGAAFLALAPVQYLGARRAWRLAGRLPPTFHRLVLRLFGIRVQVLGTPPSPSTPTLVLANHVSWLDIPVIASLRPLSFIAKQEIAGWPVVGLLARLQRCVFVDRTRKAATAEVNALVGRRLAGGEAIVLFPEGTTGDGQRLLPFRSSLVGAARAALADTKVGAIQLTPLAIAYRTRRGLPVTRREMPEVAWYGDMELTSHLGGFLRGGPLDVVVVWGRPIPFDDSTDRKRATAEAEASVRTALGAARAGRFPLTGPPAILLGPGKP